MLDKVEIYNILCQKASIVKIEEKGEIELGLASLYGNLIYLLITLFLGIWIVRSRNIGNASLKAFAFLFALICWLGYSIS